MIAKLRMHAREYCRDGGNQNAGMEEKEFVRSRENVGYRKRLDSILDTKLKVASGVTTWKSKELSSTRA